MIELQEDNLSQVIKENDKVVVQYGASWCGICRMFKPKFKQHAEKNEGIAFVYVDAEKYPNSRQLANVTNLPTFASFVGGEIKTQKQGSNDKIIEDIINEIANN